MKLSPRVGVLAGLLLLAAAGLVAPGLAGSLGIYVWLGVFPGLALARLVLPRAAAITRATLGLLLSPLVSAVAGWALVRAGLDLVTATRLIAIGGWILYAGGEARTLGTPADDPLAWAPTRAAWGWLAACVAFVALPVLLDPWILVRSDTWVHGAIVEEIRRHGFPPVDPRFIGIRLNYVWIFHLFVAMLGSVRGQDPFVFMAIFNVVNMAVLMAVVGQLAHALWDDARAALGAMMLFVLGLNAGAWMLWPLHLLRALTGTVRGAAEMRRIAADTRLDGTDILYVLSAPYAHMVNVWDKFTLGGPLGGAYLYLLLHWWALAHAWKTGERRWWIVAFAAGAGSVLLHSVVALGMIPVSMAALTIALLARRRAAWWPAPGATVGFAAATLAGFVAALPYLVAVASGWRDENSGMKHHLLQVGWKMPWTLLTSCGVTATFAAPAARRAFREQRPLAAWLAIWAAGLALLACVVHLPEGNEHKFVWEISAALALVGGAAFLPALERWRARLGTPVFATVFALVFLLPPAAFLRGYVFDPARETAPALHPAPGEEAMYAWMREHTSPDDVFIDHRSRDLILVRAGRRMIAGTPFAADRAAFPAADLANRRRVTDDLYGPVAHVDDDLAVLADVVARARRVHRVGTLAIVYREADFPGDAPWDRLQAAAGSRAQVWYQAPGFRVIALGVPEPEGFAR